MWCLVSFSFLFFLFFFSPLFLASGIAVFRETSAFNGDVSKWDTSKVTNINGSTYSFSLHSIVPFLALYLLTQLFYFVSPLDTVLLFRVWRFSSASGVAVFGQAFMFNGDLSEWDTAAVDSMSTGTCSSLYSLVLFLIH